MKVTNLNVEEERRAGKTIIHTKTLTSVQTLPATNLELRKPIHVTMERVIQNILGKVMHSLVAG